MDRRPIVYMLASGRAGTLYIGVTSNLLVHLYQHRNDLIPGFTSRYGVHRLVWFKPHPDMPSAIRREKQLKKWNRDRKPNLIEAGNPDRDDLAIGPGFEPSKPGADESPPALG